MFKIKNIGTSCILYVHLHRDTIPYMMSTYAYTMMMTTTIMLDMIHDDHCTSKRLSNYNHIAEPCRPRVCASLSGGPTFARVGRV